MTTSSMVVDVLRTAPGLVASPPEMVVENLFRPPYAVARGRFLRFQLPGLPINAMN